MSQENFCFSNCSIYADKCLLYYQVYIPVRFCIIKTKICYFADNMYDVITGSVDVILKFSAWSVAQQFLYVLPQISFSAPRYSVILFQQTVQLFRQYFHFRQILHFDPQQRFESEGTPVPVSGNGFLLNTIVSHATLACFLLDILGPFCTSVALLYFYRSFSLTSDTFFVPF